MASAKFPEFDWIGEGWRAWGILGDVPALGLFAHAISSETIADLEALQDRLTLFLDYTLSRRRPKEIRIKRKGQFDIRGRSSEVAIAAHEFFTDKLGFKFKPNEQLAFKAHSIVGKILSDHCIDAEDRELLPLVIASISGTGVYLAAHNAATKNRPRADRRSRLRRAMEQCIQNHPGETASQILHRLQSDKVVDRLENERVWYWKDQETLVDIGIDRFENVFGEAKKAVETAARKGQRLRSSTG